MHKFDRFTGEVAEWSIASDLKSDEAKTSGSSNLPLSVERFVHDTLQISSLTNTFKFVRVNQSYIAYNSKAKDSPVIIQGIRIAICHSATNYHLLNLQSVAGLVEYII